MSEVWRAVDESGAGPFALKLSPKGSLREPDKLSRLAHPNVVRVLEVGQDDLHDFLVMPWFEGRPLTRWLESSPRWPVVLARLLEAGAGLAAAHAAGVVHGDFKPDNVLVGLGRAVVIDFGAQAEGHTAGYLAPERLHGAPADAKSDQFAFCVTAYEALYRATPFDSRDARLFGVPRPPPRGRAPDALFAPIRRGLEACPTRRHPSMRDLVAALEVARRP